MSNTSSKHTPGPWRVSPGAPGEFHTILSKGEPIAHVLPTGDKLQVITDARLIAAAPELLEVLEQAVASYHLSLYRADGTPCESKWVVAARAAIAKAIGNL